jgi:hypothetical protein
MRPALALASFALFGACERIDYIELVPSEVIFKQPNNSAWMEAKCMARNGVRAVKARVEWSVGDPAVAKVDNKGLLTPVADGDTEVIARVGDVEARVPVRVIYVERIEVEPKSLTLTEGDDAATPTVRAFRKDGKPITDRTTTLKSNDQKVVQVVGGGSLLPLDPGTTTVDVQVDGAKASISVTVQPEKTPKKK